jgi:ParB family chromosome partitioning protein
METKQILVPLTSITPGPYQSRRHFDPDKLLTLAQQINDQGLLNPPIVMPPLDSIYRLIGGERRFRSMAALYLYYVGLFPSLEAAINRVAQNDGPHFISQQPTLTQTITVRMVTNATPEEMHLAAIADNQREIFNPIEEALELKNLMDTYKWSMNQLAIKRGKSYPTVRSRLLLLELDPEIQTLVAQKRLPKDLKTTQALLSIPDPKNRIALAHHFAKHKSGIRAIENACKKVLAQQPKKNGAIPKTTPKKTPIKQALIINQKPPTIIKPKSILTNKELIANTFEEACLTCLFTGFTQNCLSCEGAIEVLNRLHQLVQT